MRWPSRRMRHRGEGTFAAPHTTSVCRTPSPSPRVLLRASGPSAGRPPCLPFAATKTSCSARPWQRLPSQYPKTRHRCSTNRRAHSPRRRPPSSLPLQNQRSNFCLNRALWLATVRLGPPGEASGCRGQACTWAKYRRLATRSRHAARQPSCPRPSLIHTSHARSRQTSAKRPHRRRPTRPSDPPRCAARHPSRTCRSATATPLSATTGESLGRDDPTGRQASHQPTHRVTWLPLPPPRATRRRRARKPPRRRLRQATAPMCRR
mmetsp:Transcript_3725/g.9035  ORF Transcript_3725/g.9035 Transcript_3725/m.9035 type:complete len:264 (-) Transcript_3725:242-1033(-)